MSDKTQGIVIRSVDFSETSKIVTLWTLDFGKIGAMAKGGRRLKSPFENALELLSLSTVTLIRKPHADLDLLIESVIVERFIGLRERLPALYAGYFIAETLDGLMQPDDPHPELFHLAVTTLRALSDGADVLVTLSRYAMQLLGGLGLLPRLDACAVCGHPCEMGVQASFSFSAGGVVCGHCERGAGNSRVVSADTIVQLQRSASRAALAGETEVFSSRVAKELPGIWMALIEIHLNRKLRTATLLTFS